MCACNQLMIARMDLQIVHRHRRQPCHEPLPALPTIHRHVRADIRSKEQEIGVDQIFANHMHEVRTAGRQRAGETRERGTIVLRPEHVGREVATPMVVEGHVERGRIVMRRFHAAHVRAFRHAGEPASQLLPRRAVIARQPDLAVISAGIQEPRSHIRFGKRRNRAERLRAGRIERDTAGGFRADTDLHRVTERQVRRDHHQIVAAAGRLDDAVCTGVEHRWIMRREQKRRVPVPSHVKIGRVLQLHRAERRNPTPLHRRLRLRRVAALDDDGVFELHVPRTPARLHQARALAGGHVEATDVAALALAVDNIRVGRIVGGVEPVAAADVHPVLVADGAAHATTRTAPRPIVLQPTTDAIRNLHVVADRVELADVDDVHRVITSTPIPRLRHAAVIADNEMLRIIRIDPHRVMVDVDSDCRITRRLAAVIRHLHRR